MSWQQYNGRVDITGTKHYAVDSLAGEIDFEVLMGNQPGRRECQSKALKLT
jgi:hypothetical protein